MSNEQLANLTQPQRAQLAFVELRVRFTGETVTADAGRVGRTNE